MQNETDPNLKFDSFLVSEDGFNFEVDADGRDERRRERVVCITEEKRCLANGRVADNQQFEHIVVVLVRRLFLPFLIHCCHLLNIQNDKISPKHLTAQTRHSH